MGQDEPVVRLVRDADDVLCTGGGELRLLLADAHQRHQAFWPPCLQPLPHSPSRCCAVRQMEMVYDPANLDGIHTIKASQRNNRRKNDFTEYVEANARYSQMMAKASK